MGQISTISITVLERFLIQARLTGAQASLRLEGPHARIFGDLHIHAIRSGGEISLSGLHRRDSVPDPGTPVSLTVLLGEEVLTMHATLIAPTVEGDGTILHLSWPQVPAQIHPRRQVRVAAPAQNPLKAKVGLGTRVLEALLMNLTETGVGLAFQEALMLDLHTTLEIDAELPDGTALHCPGEVCHLTYLEGHDYPTRLGVMLRPTPTTDLGPMLQFIQARRTDRSQSLRQS
jgi:hypothetical protein